MAKQKTYLMTDSNTTYTKIGKSINPHFREKTLQSEKPTITLFAICEDDIEELLHTLYQHKRVRGEWFDLSSKEIESIINAFQFKKVDEIQKGHSKNKKVKCANCNHSTLDDKENARETMSNLFLFVLSEYDLPDRDYDKADKQVKSLIAKYGTDVFKGVNTYGLGGKYGL